MQAVAEMVTAIEALVPRREKKITVGQPRRMIWSMVNRSQGTRRHLRREQFNKIVTLKRNTFCHNSLPQTAASADEEKEVQKNVGGGKTDHDQRPENGILAYSV